MEFNANKAIYIQIAEHICEQIILGTWPIEGKIPSVRDMAVQLEVNPNTVMRTYDLLQQKEIIFNKRGIGFFVAVDSLLHIKEYKKSIFVNEDLPQFFKNIYLLDFTFEELQSRYQTFVEAHYNK